jgi:hypothetical protein
MRYILAFMICIAALLPRMALAQAFQTTVSGQFGDEYVQMVPASSTMEVAWFTQNAGGRTVYSQDVGVGNLTHSPTPILAHATWVISYDAQTRTVNLKPGQTHITNWLGNQRCNVFEDGTCNCRTNPNWNYCGYAPMATYVTMLVVYARAASINATLALQNAGYTVTRN